MKRFIARNDGFTCAACGTLVTKAIASYRNHCTQCLASRHVDVHPGDRQATCGGIMNAVLAEQRHGVWVLTHVCDICGFTRKNQTLPDDSQEVLMDLVRNPKNN